jgi:hypothetical protein
VRALGRFLEDPLDVPWVAVEMLAEQLDVADASCVKKYVQRTQTAYEHAWEIRDRYGYRSFDDADSAFARFLDGRAWTHAEGPVALFDHAVGWLRRNRMLLPGVSVLARQVAAAREAAEARLYEALATAARRVDTGLPSRLVQLLQVPDGARVSELERLRRSPRRSSGPEMVKALPPTGQRPAGARRGRRPALPARPRAPELPGPTIASATGTSSHSTRCEIERSTVSSARGRVGSGVCVMGNP